MKKKLIVALVILTSMFLQAEKFSVIDLGLNLGGSILQEGDHKDIPEMILAPKPDSFSSMNFSATIQAYFTKNLGLETSYSFSGTTKAFLKGYEPMSCYDNKYLEFGPVARLIGKIGSSIWSLNLSGGVTYSMLSINSEFDDFFISNYNYTFREVEPDFGFYAKIGVKNYFYNYFFSGIELKYLSLNNKFKGSDDFNGKYVNFNFNLGLAL